MDALDLYWISGSPYAWRVMLVLEHKSLAYRSHLLEMSKGELRTPEFRALNPRGRVPVLRHGSFVLTESLAILQYLEAIAPEPVLFGVGPVERALVARAIAEFSSYLEAPIESIITSVYFGEVEARRRELDAAIPAMKQELRALEERIARDGWLAPHGYSAADVAVYPFVMSLRRAAGKDAAKDLGLEVEPFAERTPALDAWCRRIEALPGHDRTVPPHWKAAP